MTFYLTCSQLFNRFAVMVNVTIVQVMGPATRNFASLCASLDLNVAVATWKKCMF